MIGLPREISYGATALTAVVCGMLYATNVSTANITESVATGHSESGAFGDYTALSGPEESGQHKFWLNSDVLAALGATADTLSVLDDRDEQR